MTPNEIILFYKWLNEEKAYKRFIKNIKKTNRDIFKKGIKKELVTSNIIISQIINRTLTWHHTKEGHAFWENLHNKWVGYCQFNNL